jgi:hypothetical protein
MATATIHAGGDGFRNFHQAEKRTVQIDWADRLIGFEVPADFAWYVPTGMSAIGSATGFYYSAWNSATASGADPSSATASALASGSGFSMVTLSGQNNFDTGTAYTISGQITTDDGHLYVEAFNVWTWAGVNIDG